MKNISLRKFRTEVVDIREPVEVSRRDRSGNIEMLGYWTPYRQGLEDRPPRPGETTAIREGQYAREPRAPGPPSPPLDLEVDSTTAFAPGPRIIRTPDEAARAVDPSVRAFPKSVQAGRKKR